jgi:predicted DNA-binding transcriptional regulator AlpA
LENEMPVKYQTRGSSTPPKSLCQFDALPASAFVQVDTVAGLMGVSRATVWRMVQRGQLPTPKKLSERATRWNVGELRAALAA